MRLDTMGDVLMTGPAIRALRATRPGTRITLLTSGSGARAGELLPWTDEVITYDAPWLKGTEPRSASAPDERMARSLRARRFDAAAIFTVYSQSPLPAALLCYLAEIPLRLAHCRENPYQLLTDWVAEPEPERLVRHEVRRQLELVAAVGARTPDERLGIELSPAARTRVGALLDESGLDRDRAWVVVHPGSSAPSRRYPAEGYAAACGRLALHHGVQVVFSGDRSELALVESIRPAMGAESLSLAGELELEELAALLEAAPVLVAGNTGPVHLAAAVSTPVVDLYALTNPQHAPWGVPSRVLFHDVPCRWCYKSVCPEGHHACLRRVSPDALVQATLELMRAPVAAAGDPGPLALPMVRG